MGEKKVALFALIPDNDASFNFLVSLLYCQHLSRSCSTRLTENTAGACLYRCIFSWTSSPM